MKYLKIIFITILLLTIMIIPVNATNLTLPELPGDYEDYIIFDGSFTPSFDGIVGITFNNIENMYVGTLEEFLDEIYPITADYTPQENKVLYFTGNLSKLNLESKRYNLVGNDWEYIGETSNSNKYRYGGSATRSINNSDILYSSLDIIDLSDGSVFFFKGSWMKAIMTRPLLGMIQYLIGLLIISVAFLKGLQFLFKTLRKA